MIYLSASGIKDYLSCSQRYNYRRHKNNLAVDSTNQKIGKVVHEVLCDSWNKPDILDITKNVAGEYNLDRNATAMAMSLINNFKSFPQLWGLIDENDYVEFDVTRSWNDDVEIFGTLDRLTDGGVILDWKTNSALPVNISRDIQFLLYDWLTKGKYRMAAVHLDTKQIIWYNRDEFYYKQLLEGVIPKMIEDIETDNYALEGLFRGTCKSCQFGRICELESRNPAVR